MYIVKLKKNEEKRIINGHPWIYANEVQSIEKTDPIKDTQGSICKVISSDNRFIGLGYINHASKIIVRIMSYKEEEINEEFIYNRIKDANDRRIALGYIDNYRVVFGESDLLPGLIVDKYGKYLSVQILTLGMEVRKQEIVNSLVKIFNPNNDSDFGIYERSDVDVRLKEGLKETKGFLYNTFVPKTIITENGVKLRVDLENGQKTGYFLDQKENRNNLKFYVKDKDVLDCFCNVGGFSLMASFYGAKSVTSLDISELAIEEVKYNSNLNGFTNINPICCDVFTALREYKKENKKFDVIILDPPAFTKSIDTVKEGYKGYLDINSLALKLLNKGGYLITCSCSQHLTYQLFMKMLEEAAIYTKKQVKLVEMRFQGKDHATLLNYNEALYLKCAVLNVL